MKNNKLLACPYIVWMILFTIIPLGIVFYYALTDSITGRFTLANLAGMGTYLDGAANAANNLRATATIDAGALADGSVTGGADLTVGDASAGIGAAIGAGKDADLTIDMHPLEIGSSTSAGIGAGRGGDSLTRLTFHSPAARTAAARSAPRCR